MNRKRVQRVYSEAGLSVRRRAWKRVAVGFVPHSMPITVNIRWSMDVVSHALADGRKIRALSVVDDFSCECPVIVCTTGRIFGVKHSTAGTMSMG